MCKKLVTKPLGVYIKLKPLHFAAAVAPVVLYKAVARVHNENTKRLGFRNERRIQNERDHLLTSIPELEMINRRRRPTKSMSMADPIAITKLKISKESNMLIIY